MEVREDRKLDGKYLLGTGDESLPAGDLALGYRQLPEVERAFRIQKSSFPGLRLVRHTKDDRIRSNVLPCWLALLTVRVAGAGMTSATIRAGMDRLQ